MRRPTLFLTVAVLAAACGGHRRALLPPTPLGGVARCALAGTLAIGATDVIRSAPRGGDVIATSNGGEVGVRIDWLEAGGRARVVVREPPSGPALALTGYLAVTAVPLRARRALPVAGRSIRIAEGAAVAIRFASDRSLRVGALHTDFSALAAPATCDDVGLASDVPRVQPPAPPAGAEPFHLDGRRARFFERPEGTLLAEVPADREGPTFLADRAVRGMRHVHYAEGVQIDAWMNAEDLAPGEGPDCDHCYGGGDTPDILDRCPGKDDEDGFDAGSGCPGPLPPRVAALRDAPVISAPGGAAIGVLEAGARVWSVRAEGGRTRIASAGGVLRPPAGAGFWVESSALAPPEPGDGAARGRGATPTLVARDGRRYPAGP